VQEPFHLVVPAPQRQARAVAQSNNVILRLGPVVIEIRLIHGILSAGIHKVLPHEHPVFVAEVIEPLVLIYPATPDSEHVHVRLGGAPYQMPVMLVGDARRELVRRYPVRALGKDRHAVDDERERLPVLVLALVDLDRAQSHPAGDRV
jgi:hypothetical protein